MLSKNLRIYLSSKNLLKMVLFLVTFLGVGLAFAAGDDAGGGGGGIGGIASTVTNSFKNLAQLFLAIAYIAGVGFSIAAIFKFKQHKDNPTQIPLGTPIALLAIAVSLIFVGFYIKPLGETIGAKPTDTAGSTGKGNAGVPGL